MIDRIGYEIDSPWIPLHRMSALLVELAVERDVEPHRLLRGTGIFPEDLVTGIQRARPEQCLRLIANIQRLGPAELAFLAGQRLFARNHGAAGARLASAAHLLDALRVLERFSATLAPLWTPRLSLDGDGANLYWSDACGGQEQAGFLNRLMMTAVTSMSRRLGGQSWPWHYALPGPVEHPEQCAVHWGPRVQAEAHVAYLRIDRASLLTPWPGACTQAAAAAEQEARQHPENTAIGFIAGIDQYLRQRIDHRPSLDSAANHLGISSATLKRQLKKHRSSFQVRYDQVRQELAIEWLTRRGLSLEDVARRLHFHDGRNLRRAFKRWTGVLPSSLLDGQ